MERREIYKRLLKSQATWGLGQMGCHDIPRTHAEIYDKPVELRSEEYTDADQIDDGYMVSLDLKTGELAVKQIVDGVVIDDVDN